MRRWAASEPALDAEVGQHRAADDLEVVVCGITLRKQILTPVEHLCEPDLIQDRGGGVPIRRGGLAGERHSSTPVTGNRRRADAGGCLSGESHRTVPRSVSGQEPDHAETGYAGARAADAMNDPDVAAIRARFPGARVIDVRMRQEPAETAVEPAESADDPS